MANLSFSQRDQFNALHQEVNSQSSARVGSLPIPTLEQDREEALMIRPYYESLTNATFGNDMTQDGSITPVEFRVASDPTHTYTVYKLLVWIESGNLMDFHSGDRLVFGSAGFLANGIRIVHRSDANEGTIDLMPYPIQDLQSFVFLSDKSQFINALHGSGGNDTVFLTYDLPHPAVNYWNENIRVVVQINDDLTSLDRFEMVALGTREIR